MIDHEARAETLRAEQIRRGRALDERRPPLDVLSRFAHDRGEALLYTGRGSGFTTIAALPGEALSSWPEKAA